MSFQPAVVVATDFSEPSALAYREALQLADLVHADLRILHVVESHDAQQEQQAAAWLEAQKLAPEAVTTLPGTPWVQIIRYVDALRPLLLVIGSHGRGGYQPLRPGSTTACLLVRSPVPLLVVPQRSLTQSWGGPMEIHRSEQRSSHV
jgi:nucleotide-binding universal stress UspA family protein